MIYIFLPDTIPHSQLLVCIGGIILLKEERKWTSSAGLVQSQEVPIYITLS